MSDPLWVNAGVGTSVGTAVIEADDETFTIAAHGLSDGDAVVVDSITGGAVGVLAEDTVYFVRDAAVNTFTLAGSPGGNVIPFATDGGADVHTAVPQYNATELRRAQGMFLTPGVTDRFGARGGVRPHSTEPVTLAGTTWTVEDLTAVVYPGVTSQSGPYVVQHPEESGALDAADGTNDRIDGLDLQVQDDDEDASGFRRARVVYTAGTPAGTPSAPAVAANSIRLATILVGSGGAPAPALTVVAPYTVALGGVLPVRDTTELPAAGRYVGMMSYNLDTEALLVWDGSAWVSIAGPGASPATVQHFDSTGIFEFTNTSFGVTSSAGTYVDCGVAFTAPLSGRVMLHWQAALDIASGSNAVAYCSPVVRTGTTVGSGTTVLAAADNNSRRVSRSQVGTDDGGSRNRSGCSYLLSGLTAGSSYNVRLEHRVTSQTGELFHRAVQVVPAT